MAIAVRGASTTAEAAISAALTINVPASTVDGDLLVWVYGDNQAPFTIPPPPTGWTLAVSGSTTAFVIAVWYRIAASEPASYSTGTRTNTSRAYASMTPFSGVDRATPFDVTTPAVGVGTTATSPPAITPVTQGAWVLGAATSLIGAGLTGTYSSSNLTTVDTTGSSTTASTNVVGALGHFVWTSGAFTPTFTCSQTTTRTLGASLALRPAIAPAAVLGGSRRTRPLPVKIRRGRSDRVPAQTVITPAPYVPETRRRPPKGFAPRRRTRTEVPPPQIVVTPPAYKHETRRRLVRGFVALRRRRVEVVPPQVVVAPPPYVPDTRRRAVRAIVAPRRDRSVEVVSAQAQPPVPTGRRTARFFLARRPRRIVVPASPQAIPPDVAGRRPLRRVASRRRRPVEVVPPQIVVTPPAYVHETRRRIARGFVALRRRRVEVVPPQAAPTPPPAYVSTIPAKHNLRGVPRRGRHVAIPPPQATPSQARQVPTMPDQHTLRGVPRRGRRADVPHEQTPAHRGQPRRPIRALLRRVGRAAVGVMTPGAVTPPLTTPEKTLVADVYSRVLVAETINRPD